MVSRSFFDNQTLPSYFLRMESLHAPWRIEYVLGPKEGEDGEPLFAGIAQSNDDIKNHVIARTKSSFAVLNTFPYSGGHVLVLPYRQVSDLDELTEVELLDLMKLLVRCKQAIASSMQPHGFNVGLNIGRVAGAGIEEHLHFHIVPRWQGDTNFMPTIGQTSVLPEALSETADKLRAALKD
tara:strand:+ start:63232 stop:63774 length:543 start_codon:yes stop_codon:yes gene_type:complete